MQLIISIIMIVSSFSSIFFSLSDAARADTFIKGVDPGLKENPAHMPRMRWLTGGVSAESFNGKTPVVTGPVLSSSSTVWSSSKNEGAGNRKSTDAVRIVGEGELSSDLDAEGTRKRPLREIVDTSQVMGNIDQLQGESRVTDNSLRSPAWPAVDEDKEEYLQLLQEFALLSLANIPAPGMWHITGHDEGSLRTKALILAAVLGESIYQDAKMMAEDSFQRVQEVNLPRRKALQADISPPGMWQGNDDQLDSKSGKRALLADISPPGIWTDLEVNDSRFQKRILLADISPPGMWSDDGDDMQDKYHKRRLLADISPPGMWQGSDDQLTDMAQK